MDAALGVLIFGGLALFGVVALVQPVSRPSGRAQPGTRAGRPSYATPKPSVGEVHPHVPSNLGSAVTSTDKATLEALLLDAFNAALAEVAERSVGAEPLPEPLRDEEIDDLVLERSLEAVMANLGVTRQEAARVILDVFKSGRGQQGSPLAKLEAIVASPD
jgi:hypothetical protein